MTVLLVDDDPHLLAALRRALRFEPYEVFIAESAAAALWLLGTMSVDVLVTDLRMPGMSGTEFLAKVRADHPHVISIMLTGHADLATAISAINSGEVYRFFTKPCDAASLAAAIRQALELKAHRQQIRRRPGEGRQPAAEPALNGTGGDDAHAEATTQVPVFEADASSVDLKTILREVQEELDAAERRLAGGPRPGTTSC